MSSTSSLRPQTISIEEFTSRFGLTPEWSLWQHDWECPKYEIGETRVEKGGNGKMITVVDVTLHPTFYKETNGSRNGRPEPPSSGTYRMDPDFAHRWTEAFTDLVSGTKHGLKSVTDKKPKTPAEETIHNIHLARPPHGPFGCSPGLKALNLDRLSMMILWQRVLYTLGNGIGTLRRKACPSM